MAARTSSRRLSLDLFQRAVSDFSSSESALSKYIDLRMPAQPSRHNEVVEARCECCGLAEECTRAYVRRVADCFCGRWLCGLCSEAVKCELDRLGLPRHIVREEAVAAHMEVCKKYNGTVRLNPAGSVASAMADILKKGSRSTNDRINRRAGGRIQRSFSAIPSHGA